MCIVLIYVVGIVVEDGGGWYRYLCDRRYRLVKGALLHQFVYSFTSPTETSQFSRSLETSLGYSRIP